MPCEPEILLFAGMNDHLHATGFLEQLKGDEPAPKRIWEAIQTLFAAMNEVQENVTSRRYPHCIERGPLAGDIKLRQVTQAQSGYRGFEAWKNVAATEKQLESMVYRLTQERGRWPFLTPRLENATEKTRENAPPLVKQIWDFLEEQLEVAEKREMTVARFVTAANEVTFGGFWREHAKGELKTRRDHEILEFLSPCWGKEFMAGVFSAKETIFGAFIQEILNMPISLLLALYLVYPRYLFSMGPAYMFSRGVETLRIDGYLALVHLTHGELVSFHRLMKYGEPLLMGKTHSSIDTYSDW